MLTGAAQYNIHKLGFEEGSAGPEQHCHSEKVAHYFRGNLHRILGSPSSYSLFFLYRFPEFIHEKWYV